MSSGLNFDSLISLTSQGIEDLFCPFDSSFLVGFIAAPHHQVGRDSRAHKVDSVAGPDKHTHFTHAIAYRLAIDKIVFFGSIQADQYSRLTPHTLHTVEPCIELGRPADRIGHRFKCSLLATPCRCQ